MLNASEVLGFNHDDLSDLLVLSKPESKTVPSTRGGYNGRSMVFHEVDLSRDPIPKRGSSLLSFIFCGGDHATPWHLAPEYLWGRKCSPPLSSYFP